MEYDPWLEFFATRTVTAFGGTPSVLMLLFGHARDAGVKLPDLRECDCESTRRRSACGFKTEQCWLRPPPTYPPSMLASTRCAEPT